MISRRDEVVELRKAGLTYDEIGRRLSISRERARQIAKGKSTPQKLAPHSKLMLTTTGVAQFLGVHPNTVSHWSETGILKSYRIGPRGDRRFRREDVDDFLNEGEIVINAQKFNVMSKHCYKKSVCVIIMCI